MEVEPKDYDVVKLLTALKKEENQYPSDLFASRRQGYIRRVAEIGVGLGVVASLKTTVKAAKGASISTSVTATILEAALLVVIVGEASAAAYINRDKIVDLIRSYSSTPQAQKATSLPEAASAINESTAIVEVTETPIPTGTTTETLIPTVIVNNDAGKNQANSTPDPNGNNGNHFGQTANPPKKPGDGDSKDKGKGGGK